MKWLALWIFHLVKGSEKRPVGRLSLKRSKDI
jgi:hypothetical protein